MVSNSLDPDQDRHYVGPDLGPNFFPLACKELNISIENLLSLLYKYGKIHQYKKDTTLHAGYNLASTFFV